MAPIVQLPEYKGHYDVAETALVIDEVKNGSRRAAGLFQEAMLHTDMPLAFNQLTNAALVQQYPQAEPQHGAFTRPTTLKDFTKQSYLEVWPTLDPLPATEGGKPRIPGKAPLIAPNTEYPTASLDESNVEFKLDKYGLRMPLTMEMIVNDQLGILANYPEALAVFLRQVEDYVVAETLIKDDRTGVRDDIARVTGNPVLGLDSLNDAIVQFGNIKVRGNRPNISQAALMVPRSLERKAKAITSVQLWDDTVSEPGKTLKNVANPSFGMNVVVFDVLEDVNLNAKAAQTWFLVANAAQLVGRPSLVAATLRGYERPQTFISSPNALTALGSPANWKDGSFLNDSIEFKVRHFFGAALVFKEGVLASQPA